MALSQAYLDAMETLRTGVAALNQLCWDYARYHVGAEASDFRLAELDAEIARRTEAGINLGTLAADRAAEAALGNGIRIAMGLKAAAYPPLVAAINAHVAGMNVAFAPIQVSVTLPDLEAYVDIITAGDYPPLPPGVG